MSVKLYCDLGIDCYNSTRFLRSAGGLLSPTEVSKSGTVHIVSCLIHNEDVQGKYIQLASLLSGYKAADIDTDSGSVTTTGAAARRLYNISQ